MLCPMALPICLSSLRNLSPSRASLNSHPPISRSIQHSPPKDGKQPLADRSFNVSSIEHPLANQVLNKESQVILSTQDFVDQRIRPSSQKLWVIESRATAPRHPRDPGGPCCPKLLSFRSNV